MMLEETGAEQDPRTLFFTNKGEPFDPTTLGTWWKGMLQAHPPSFPNMPSGMHGLRSVFATDLLSAGGAVEGVAMQDAAVGMGNSLPTVKQHYHINRVADQVQKVADTMSYYREVKKQKK